MNGFEGFSFDKDTLIKLLNVEDAITSGSAYFPSSGSFVDVMDYERFAYLYGAGSSGSAVDLQVMQSTSTGSSGMKAISGASGSIGAGATGSDKWTLIEVQTDQLDINNDFRYVSLRTAGAGANTFGSIYFIGLNAGKRPVTQDATKNMATILAG